MVVWDFWKGSQLGLLHQLLALWLLTSFIQHFWHPSDKLHVQQNPSRCTHLVNSPLLQKVCVTTEWEEGLTFKL